ncbi:hypothetical protein BS78_10G134100 [Paspalum vaginatum]|nr:hypothetical protein BS78_10G134100 [Paspalum vaginatum]
MECACNRTNLREGNRESGKSPAGEIPRRRSRFRLNPRAAPIASTSRRRGKESYRKGAAQGGRTAARDAAHREGARRRQGAAHGEGGQPGEVARNEQQPGNQRGDQASSRRQVKWQCRKGSASSRRSE